MSIIRQKYDSWREKKRQDGLKEKKSVLKDLSDKKKIIIFSNDCVGGRLMKDYYLPQYTPMVNIWYSAADFLKICREPEKYLSLKLSDVRLDENGIPSARLGDTILHFNHDNNLDAVVRKWEKGCRAFFKAVKSERHEICVVMNDRNGFDDNMVEKFEYLPYTYKILFTHKKYASGCTFYMKGDENKEFVEIMTNFEGWFTLKRRYDRFDFYQWFYDMYSSED